MDKINCNNIRLFFAIFFPETTIDHFVRGSNNHGVLRGVRNWNSNKPIDSSEFKAFLVAILFQRMYTSPSRKKAWNTGPKGNKYLRSIMTRQRFEVILDAWSYEDYSSYPSPEFLDALKAADPFWAVRSFCNGMATRFGELFSPYQSLTIDEQCCPWKGRHKCRCYNPNKPEKWHFKFYSLNDARTAYELDFEPYQGKPRCEMPTFQQRPGQFILFCEMKKNIGIVDTFCLRTIGIQDYHL